MARQSYSGPRRRPRWEHRTPAARSRLLAVQTSSSEDYHQQYLDKVPNGYCPNHSTGVTLPADLKVTPLQYVD